MLCVPTARLLVLQAAVLLLPVPLSATVAQLAIELPPSVKLTVPVGLLPVTVAVNATLVPTVAGLAELTSVVVVGCRLVHDGNLNEPMRVCQLPAVPSVWLS
jgi:hypothetical protein